jgi:hypothetical protein
MSEFPSATEDNATLPYEADREPPAAVVSTPEISGKQRKPSVTDRFLTAKDEQRRREEERKSSFRSARHNGTPMTSISGRFEQAKLEQLEKEQSRRSSFKSLNTSCTSSPTIFMIFLYLHMKFYLGIIHVSIFPSYPALANTSSISGRFEKAKKEQTEKERQKKEKIRASREDPNIRRQSGGRWEDILEESKSKEKERFEAKKKSTLSGYRTTEGTGVVKRRVGEFEVLFIQKSVGVDQIEATVRAAILARRASCPGTQEDYDPDNPEVSVIS